MLRLTKIALATMMTVSMVSGLTVSGLMTNEASANTLQRTSAPRRTTVQPGVMRSPVVSPSQNFSPQLSTTGNWKGAMHSQGDDVLANFELSISGGQGNWQLIGAEYNAATDTWQPAVLNQGTLTTSVSGTQVTMQLVGSGMNMTLNGAFQNGGTTISGHQVGSPNYVFYFSKS